MAYRPLAPAIPLPPQVARLMWKLERHYFTPVHAMFRLPLPNYAIVGHLQFSIANVLLSAVSGLSTTLYAHSGGNGQRFRESLQHYYPFDKEPSNSPSAAVAADTLWSVLRNPLAHDLGFDVERKAKTPETKYMRRVTAAGKGDRGLTERMIEALEDHSTRPTKRATVEVRADATVLSVDALYWGVRCMAERMLSDPSRVRAAESFLATL